VRRPAGSYTAKLLDGGVDGIGTKICEEAGELVEAARLAKEAPDHVIHEAADLIYHLLVMLAHCRVTWSDVEQELSRRFGTKAHVPHLERFVVRQSHNLAGPGGESLVPGNSL